MTLAYFWGEDAFRLEEAARDLAKRLADAAGQPIDTWRTDGDDDQPARVLDEIEQRTTTGTLFGAGTVVVVRQPQALIKDGANRDRLLKLLDSVAPGNALAFVDLVASGKKDAAGASALRDAVAKRGGTVAEFPPLARERMESWLDQRARTLGLTLGPGAARLLAERVGAHVREGDVDRRRQTELAATELDKLALYRPGGVATRDDVVALVEEAIPGSAWALLDAIGSRRAGEAATLTERVLNDGLPIQVLVAQFHRRLRELIAIAEHLATGSRPADIIREMRLAPYRAQKLAEQARAWPPEQLEAALADLSEVDLLSKGVAPDGSQRSVSEDRSRLALFAWLGQRISRQA